MIPNTILAGGAMRDYLVHLPKGYSPDSRYPLLLGFHGAGGRADHMERLTKLHELADREQFVLVYPSGLDKHWSDGRKTKRTTDDVGFILVLLDKLRGEYSIDDERIFAAGISNGGFFAQHLTTRCPGLFAAVASVCANTTYGLFEAPDFIPTPIVFILGTADKVVPYEGGGIGVGRVKLDIVASADETMKVWVARNNSETAPVIDNLGEDDSTSVNRRWYHAKPGGAPSVLYEIVNGGHTWPSGWQYLSEMYVGKTSRVISADEEIWKFFKSVKP